MRVHHLVVPGRHLAVRLVLRWIPVRRDIGILGLEDHQRRRTVGDLLPEWIGARHVGDQAAFGARLGVQQEGQMIGIQTVGALGDQTAERMPVDQSSEDIGTVFGELRRNVQGGLRSGLDEGGRTHSEPRSMGGWPGIPRLRPALAQSSPRAICRPGS